MRRGVLIFGAVVAAGFGILWLAGGFDALGRMVEAGQRDMQASLAGAVRRLRAGDPGALAALMVACFSYGFIHAAGPGHGKVLIAGYGVGRRVPFLRLSALALASSLAQSLMAIVLVFAGITVLGWTREQMVEVSDRVMAPISYGAILALGLWLVWRGLRRVMRQRAPVLAADHSASAGNSYAGVQYAGVQSGDHRPRVDAHHPQYDHHHAPDHHPAPDQRHRHHDACGHVHGPSLQQIEAVSGARDGLALIAGIAMRPCTGALFLLILTWQMGIFGSGVAGVLAMGIGTASVTVAVAAMAVWAREGALASLPGARLAAALPLLEICAGAVVALSAGQLLLHSF